jgi:HK97 family phage portal protein
MARDAVEAPVRMVGFPSTGGGVAPYAVDSYTAHGLSAVWRSLDILCNSVTQLDWRELRLNAELPPSRLVRNPSALITRRDWVSRVVESMALYDAAFLLKVGGVDSEGVTMGLWPLDPTMVTPVQTQLPFMYPPEVYWVYGARVDADQLVILRRSMHASIPDHAAGILRLARTSLAAAMSAENYASRFWQAGGATSVVLETEQRLQPGQKSELSEAWRDRRSKGPDYAPVMDGGIRARDLGADPTAQSAVEARRELVADLGRHFGIPTALLNAPAGDSETYRSNDQANADLVRYTIQNYVDAIEDAISSQLPGGREMEMDLYPLLRASQLLEAQALNQLTGGKALMAVDEARDVLGLVPMEDPESLNPPPPAPVAAPAPAMPMPMMEGARAND